MPATLIRAVALLAMGAAAGVVLNALRPGGLSFLAIHAPTSCEDAPGGGPAEILPEEAVALCGQTDVVIADARSELAYAQGHVADAIHLPCDATGQVAAEGMAHLERAHTVIVYGDSTESARPVASSLLRRRRGDVRVLRGGVAAWASAGLACASGQCKDCRASHP